MEVTRLPIPFKEFLDLLNEKRVEKVMDDPKFSFYIDGVFAATFEEEHLPKSDGRYRYMPYRGSGHYDLCRTIDAFGFARCFYEAAGE